ncbi:MFS transporter [Microbacterium sp. cx-55]|uniref:MFS transporter n=1 Tax=unclassified Microbacterium TaxID=2609290 RepID=UPI001CBAEB18|nr:MULTISPECIES: MFS transporter [unclassified Microbacterium]MBZ4486761.1 MFS transporter [Microbacterium sp. cx-55]MCC4907738.1 MFS transporter [Microbacterium sp. cx-59]UGB36282.1 MFS transporter [Microbacterium sp. cx-55]
MEKPPSSQPLGDMPAFPLDKMPETSSVPAGAKQSVYPMVAIPVAMLGLIVALLPPLLVTMALRLREMDADAVTGNLSLVLGIGAFFAFVANPIGGRLSDRSMSRFGMRKPWIVLGGAIGYIGIVIITFSPNVGFLILGWSITSVGFNFALAALIAMLPDQIRPSRRGRVASFVSLAQNLAPVGATYIVQLFPMGLAQSLVPSALGLVLVFVMIAGVKDRRRTEPPKESLDLKTVFGSFVFNPRKFPDLGWAWLTRFFLVVAQATALGYLVLFLIDHLGVSPADAPNLVFQATLANAVGILLTTTVLGWLSDKLGRRKPFVVASALIAVVGLTIMAFAPDFTWVLAGQLILGGGMGAFFAVDLALISDVLPSEEDSGKDLGVVNIAQALPQSLVPIAAPGVVAAFGYPGLFLGGAFFGVLGALAVLRVKKVR